MSETVALILVAGFIIGMAELAGALKKLAEVIGRDKRHDFNLHLVEKQ